MFEVISFLKRECNVECIAKRTKYKMLPGDTGKIILTIMRMHAHFPLCRFLPERFSKSMENNNHSRIIYRNDNIASPVKT